MPRPARAAAPSAVVSRSAATSIGTPRTSAWNCIRKPLAVAPPSARNSRSSNGRASRTSATWNAIPSSVARTRCARVVPRVRPAIRPRASGSQCGEPRPVSAGTNTTPPDESTLCASASVSEAAATRPSPSRSHCTAAPLARTAPSSAKPPGAAAVFRRPCGGASGESPTCARTKLPVPYVTLASPGPKQPWPTRAACWSPATPETGSRAPPSSASATPPVPEQGCLALVRDPDRAQIAPGETRGQHGLVGGRDDAGPDLVGIVLDPTRLREVLRQLAVAPPQHLEALVDDQAGRARRPL